MIACARMYAVSPSASAAWRRLFEWVAARAQVAMEVIDHPYPAPLEALWEREDMGCVFMCGFPYARRDRRPQLIGAPVPSPARYGGRPIYFTDFVVRAESPYQSLENTFGGRFAYTTEGSHSGYNAARHHLLAHRTTNRQALYAQVVGPLITPRRAVEAVLGGNADVAPVDSYSLDLMRRHTPDLVAVLRVVASTMAAPIPPIVASPGMPGDACRRLTAALLSVHRSPDISDLREVLLLSRFEPVQPADYEVLVERSRVAEEAGYPRIA